MDQGRLALPLTSGVTCSHLPSLSLSSPVWKWDGWLGGAEEITHMTAWNTVGSLSLCPLYALKAYNAVWS